MAEFTIYQDSFFGGVQKDERNRTQRGSAGSGAIFTEHFNVYDFPHKLKPFRNTENLTSGVDVYALAFGNNKLIGMSDNGSSRTAIVIKDDTTGGGIFDNDLWVTPANAENNVAGNGTANNKSFAWYQNAVYYTDMNGNVIEFTHPDIGSAGNATTLLGAGAELSATNGATGQMWADPFSKILYIPYGDKIAQVASTGSGGTLNATAYDANLLGHEITCIFPFGAFLAIGLSPVDHVGRSFIHLWDRNTDNSTPVEVIDLGEGDVKLLGRVDDALIAVIDRGLTQFTSLDEGALTVRAYAGRNYATKIAEIKAMDNSIGVNSPKAQFKDGRMYFPAGVNIDGGTEKHGIFVVYRDEVVGNFHITLDTVVTGATAASSSIQDIIAHGNFWWVSYNSITGQMARTNNDTAFTETSRFSTQRFTAGFPYIDKKMVSFGITYEQPRTSGTVIVNKKQDNETTFATEVINQSGIATGGTIIVAEDTSGNNFGDWKEVEFEITTTGGVCPTSYWFTFEHTETLIE
jgi:hypothetical protein